MKITSRYDSTRVLWEGEADSIRDAAERAVVSGANLSYANLRYANLSGADLRYANLSGADLRYANLSGANLSGANLSGANLSGANLRGADLSGANLRGANLRGADLSGANLSGANLSGASDIDCAQRGDIVRLPVGDPRGYDCLAQWDGAQWIIMSGCRRFTADEAAEHWGESYSGVREIGDRYLFGIGCLTGVEPPQDSEVAA